MANILGPSTAKAEGCFLISLLWFKECVGQRKAFLISHIWSSLYKTHWWRLY